MEALEALPYWSHSSLYLVTTRLRGDAPAAPGASSCAPLLRLSWTSAELLSEEVQRLPFAELPGPLQVLATPWNQVARGFGWWRSQREVEKEQVQGV